MYCFFLGFYDWFFTLAVGIYCNYARKQKRHPVISNRVAHNKCYSWKKSPSLVQVAGTLRLNLTT